MYLNNKHIGDTNLSCKYAILALWNIDFRFDSTKQQFFLLQIYVLYHISYMSCFG